MYDDNVVVAPWSFVAVGTLVEYETGTVFLIL